MAITLLFSEQALAGDWEKLGGRSSNLHGDYDVIHVNDLRRYDYIKLKGRKAGVNFRDVTVVFGNGERKTLPVRKCIPKNGETLAWGLPRGGRFIRNIILKYQICWGADEKARILVYGKRKQNKALQRKDSTSDSIYEKSKEEHQKALLTGQLCPPTCCGLRNHMHVF